MSFEDMKFQDAVEFLLLKIEVRDTVSHKFKF